MNQDKLGFYCVGDLKFYSKIEAIQHMQRSGIHLSWNFNNAVFESHDWTKEPADSILELYRRRAQQLRDQYDHIVLFYSGGADSQTVLESFVDNDIKIDELATMVNYQGDSVKNSYFNSETFNVVLPKIDALKQRFPWIQHRIVDLSQFMIDYFSAADSVENFYYAMNNAMNPNSVSREGIGLKVKEWRDLIHQGKKVCMLWGSDKPRVVHHNGKFFYQFQDVLDNGPTVKSIAGQQPYHDELFFWTPDLPEICIKQGHLIKNYLSHHDVTSLPFVSKVNSGLAFKVVNGVKHWISVHGVHEIIYPAWDINTFSAGKGNGSLIFSLRDSWFFNLELQLPGRKNWQHSVDRLWKILPDYWKNDCGNMSRGIRGCVTLYPLQ